MKGFGENNKPKKKKSINYTAPSKEQIITKAIKLHAEGNILEATKYYQYLINQGFEDERVFSNYGLILKNIGRLKESEFYLRKAVELNPIDIISLSNLGGILRDLGKLQEAEFFIRKVIELNPKNSLAYLNIGGILKDLGKLKEAEKLTLKAIELNSNESIAYYNLGGILRDLGKLKEAEKSMLKAIELNPNESMAHYSLGGILRDLGKLREAKKSALKAIELNVNLGKAYFLLSTLGVSTKQKNWEKYLFTNEISKNQKDINKIDIYFARANILEKRMNYIQSSKMYKKANTLNRKIFGSNYIQIKNQMEYYSKIWQRIKTKQDPQENLLTCIFIVGLPRSGKTITESILACNNELLKCGEDNALSRSINRYLNQKETTDNQNLYQIYLENISREISSETIICSTRPGNFIYTGIIASQILNSKVVYCFRNPLDNIKEMYCSNLMNQFTFKTSIVELSNILLSINELMEEYKNAFKSNIYFLNYDDLVINPEKEIKKLLSWLGWKYQEKYLFPKLDATTFKKSDNTNALINTRYINIWKPYKELLRPAIEILSSNPKYRDLIV